MEKIINCIDSYLKDLEDDLIKILENKNGSMIDKNSLIKPLSEQKKILTITKDALLNINKTRYDGSCTMWQLRE